MKAIRLIGLLCVALVAVMMLTPVTALAADHPIDVDGTVQLNTLDLLGGDTLTIAAGRTVTLVGDGTTYGNLQIICGAGVHLTLQDVQITNGNACPLSFTGAGNTLVLIGTNAFVASGLSPAVRVDSGTQLTIDGPGALNATSNTNGAGIGGGSYITGGTITILGGTITAASANGAGIGGGFDRECGTVTICGGTVNATGSYGAGIGGGASTGGAGGTVIITGGSVRAQGSNGAQNIGHGADNPISGTLTNGEGADVQLTAVTLEGTVSQAISSLNASVPYSIHDMKTGSDGKLYLYLPAGTAVTEARTATNVYQGFVTSPSTSGVLYEVAFYASYGNRYQYDLVHHTLTITQSGSYSIHMLVPGSTTKTNKIVVASGVQADITLNSVNIQLPSGSAFDMAGATVNLVLKGDNTLKCSGSNAGVHCPLGAALTISDGPGMGSGKLTAAGSSGAGIGGNPSEASGTVTISSGTVAATGVYGGAGIGGGASTGGAGGAGGTVTITGGTVTASSDAGAGIGGGMMGNGGTVVITGGSVQAIGGRSFGGRDIGRGAGGSDDGSLKNAGGVDVLYTMVTLQGVGAEAVSALTAGASYGIQDVQTDPSGNLHLYLPADHAVTEVRSASGAYRGSVAAGEYGALYQADFDVTGSAGYTYDYANRTLRFDKDGNFTVSMVNPSGTATSRIVVNSAVQADITLDDINIDLSTAGGCAFDMAGATVNLKLEGDNTLQSGNGHAGLRCPPGASLMIADGPGAGDGTLTITGGSGGAGIGGSNGEGGGTITLSSGVVFAQGDGGQDIGSGQGGSGGTLGISGTAAVFLKSNACPSPAGTTHTHLPISGHTAGGSVYGIPVPWSGSFGAYLRLYTLSYHANGWQGTVAAPATQRYNTTTAVAGSLSRTGYTFTGWNTQANGGGTAYTAGDTFTFDDNRTLYAQWQPISYKLSYDLAGGVVSKPNPVNFTFASAAITLRNPTKTGYEFIGWSGTGINGTSLNATIPMDIPGDRTYSAHWRVEDYTITYLLYGGTVSPPNPASYTIESAAITLRNPTKTGYTFSGWSGTGIGTTSMGVTIPLRSTGDRAYAANWTVSKYMITATTNNTAWGTVSGAGSIAYGTSATLKATPKTGYRFVRWLEGNTAVSTNASYTFTVTKARTLKAEFAPILYAVTLGVNSTAYGTVSGGGSIPYGTPATLKATPKAGYRFVRWLEGSITASTNASYTFTVTRARTLNAEFARISTPIVTATSVSYTSIKLSWVAVAGAQGYEVSRYDPTTKQYKVLATVTATNYINTGLTAGTVYAYKVRAKCVAGSATTYGGYSAIASAKPVPATPTGVKAVRASASSITVSWNMVLGTNGYEVYRCTTSSGNYTPVKSVTTLNWTNTGLVTGKIYYYKVRAYRVIGKTKVYGAYSAVVHAKP